MLSPSAIQRAEDLVGMDTATRPLSCACAKGGKPPSMVASAQAASSVLRKVRFMSLVSWTCSVLALGEFGGRRLHGEDAFLCHDALEHRLACHDVLHRAHELR